MSRIKSMQTLKGMGNTPKPVNVFRGGEWREVATPDLLPGDIFSLRGGKDHETVPCDLLLLQGSAVVNEATLTGESIPQMKEPLNIAEASQSEEVLEIKGQHKMHVLFGGTRLMQINGEDMPHADTDDEDEDADADGAAASDDDDAASASGSESDDGSEAAPAVDDAELAAAMERVTEITSPPDDGCVCYALRTGFSSSQGKLVRMIESSTTDTVKGNQRDTALLLCLLMTFAILASGYVLYRGMQEKNRSRYVA